MRDEKRGIDSNGLASAWLIAGFYGRGSRYQVGKSKGNASGNGKLACKVEPVMAIRTILLSI